MTEAFCDLHLHSTASDGTDPPAALGALAKAAGLAAIALTDHDTTEGLPACQAGCAAAGVGFIPGIEISVDPGVWPHRAEAGQTQRTGTLHLLGLFIRHDDPRLREIHQRLLRARADRNPQIIRRLGELGVRLDYEEVVALAQQRGSQVVGRPHIAQAMLEKGYVKSVQDAFNRYLGEAKPAYVRKDLLPAAEAMDAIHGAGGLAILAHPVQLKYGSAEYLEHFVARLKDQGLDGIETRHSDHTPAQVRQFEALAERFSLLTSGGSDYHGQRKHHALGSQWVPLAVAQRLRQALAPEHPSHATP